MLDQIREQSGHWLIKVALGAIVLVFIFWGFGAGKMNPGAEGYAAKVNGRDIPLDNYEQAYRNRQAQQRQQGKLTPELDEKFLSQQVMDDLIESELLSQFADDAGIYVSPQELADQIKKEPYFQDDKTHEFIGREKYLEFLKVRGLDVGEFEKDVERQARVAKAREFIENSVKVSPTELKDEFRARNEKVTLSYVRVDPVAIASTLKSAPISAADVDAWTKANPGKVEAIYAEAKDSQYTTPAKAELLQITVRKPTPDASGKKDMADELAAAKRRSERAMEMAATEWTKAADQYSEGAPWEKSGSPRELSRRELPLPVAEKVFAMKPGDPPALVETPTAFILVKLKSTTPEKVVELDEKLKKSIVEDEIRKQRAVDEVQKIAQQVFDRAKKGEPLTKIAGGLGLQVKETGAFPKRDEIPGIPESNAAMVAEAFKLQKAGDVLNAANGPLKNGNGYLIAALKDHQLPNDADFDKQKTWIEFSLKRAKSGAAYNAWKADTLSRAKITENPRLIRG